jgi:SAM-dependent methyltransferase
MILDQRTCSWGDVPHDNYFRLFAREIESRVPGGATVLDAGCGADLHSAYHTIRARATEFWGCDPNYAAATNTALDHFVLGELASADFGSQHFDLVLASYVLEHLSDPLPFFAKARSVLKPGAWFAFLTPNRRHPFCHCVRLVERLHLKSLLHVTYGHTGAQQWRVNGYPAYYRANTVDRIRRLGQEAGFSSGSVILAASGWEYYFARPLRFIPRAYDRFLSARRSQGHLILLGFLRA